MARRGLRIEGTSRGSSGTQGRLRTTGSVSSWQFCPKDFHIKILRKH